MRYEDKMTYNSICYTLEKEGWTKETMFIDEKMKYTALLSSARPGETTCIIDIRCPEDQKILIRGVENGDIKNFKDAYSIRLILKDSSKNEMSQLAKIRITKEMIIKEILTKERMIGDTSFPIRCFYGDINKNDNDHLYRPRKNILLQGGEHLFIYVIGENIGQKLPDITIGRDHISFNIKVDIFTLIR